MTTTDRLPSSVRRSRRRQDAHEAALCARTAEVFGAHHEDLRLFLAEHRRRLPGRVVRRCEEALSALAGVVAEGESDTGG